MKLVLTLLVVMTISAPALANSCYSTKEAEAEQGLRIHSELMVIGLNCQHMTPRGWKNFYQEYREITARNKALFHQYEETLINHYSQSGAGNAERKIHTMRTNFANKISTNAAQMRPDVFCANFAPRIPKVAQMSQQELRQWAVSAAATQPQSKPVCN
jgi:hypothetical protein